MDKRTFIKQFSLLTLTAAPFMESFSQIIKKVEHIPVNDLASDEDFWASIRGGYRLKPDYINLENGWFCILPQEILEQYIEHVREINYQGSYFMRKMMVDKKKEIKNKLAQLADLSPEELIITRNSTESLDLVIGGLHWKEGDEAIMAEQDYGAMRDMFRQVKERYGVVTKTISIPNDPKSDDEIVNLYANQITPKTKLIMVSHMINITGHILPVRKIADMAHSKGVEVLVDGAHAFAHFDFKISELNCDYYGTSLHKWLSVPLGAGFLYVKKDKIANLWPVFAETEKPMEDIARLNHTGTTPVHVDLAIANAIEYLNKLGIKRKEARLRYLQNYWTNKVRNNPNVILNTPSDPQRSCAIANVGIKNMKTDDMAKQLLDKYKIWTVAINSATVNGCRVTPNIYTTPKELDVLVSAINEMAGA
ncbi:MAG: aminotransferase class V-fold PLP-dependent enzyme [Bacteroidetes bacterium]|nr:aminotransferase class V-fold PLP-dependent enzyme [Bacteroidota bacterium]